ncbi:hypothetical protein M885DRAFT_533258 [Pelagophyceae sp. CCMP2097]|nr:hypothetical protein M885DRAFT_533258 [Pelagophyceae sp. CCMP2097]
MAGLVSTVKELELIPVDCPVADYLVPFAGAGAADDFVEYLAIGPDKHLVSTSLTRLEFFDLSLKAASILRLHGVCAGDCCVHYFTDNRLEDLVFRHAAALNGSVPVTVNWQSDTLERALFKVRITSSKLVLIDQGVDSAVTDTVPHCGAVVLDAAASLRDHYERLPPGLVCASTRAEDTRIIIFTSGTTGNPKGVRLSYGSYKCNASTFEQFLDVTGELDCVVTNPFHHTNTTAISDWCLRRPGAKLRLLQRYTTAYWTVVAAAAAGLKWSDLAVDGISKIEARVEEMGASTASTRRVVCPLVSRHVDFLEHLGRTETLPVPVDVFKRAVERGNVALLLGSAPVGPTTVARLRQYAGALPVVRFGSTETCLQVCGTLLSIPAQARLEAFEAGWAHAYGGAPACGYYIGREHKGHTEVSVVKSVDRASPLYLVPCAEGEPGQVVTRGANLMTGYVADDAATAKALDVETGWYTNLGDVGYFLVNKTDGGTDLFWLSRDSAMLIRGGANYAYEQINSELAKFVTEEYALSDEDFEVAVVGARLDSEHEDTCCVTIELKTPAAEAAASAIEANFIAKASKAVSKGSKPDRLKLATLPKNFKGVVLVKDLVAKWQLEAV